AHYWLLITRRFLRPRFPSAILGCRKPINSTMCLKPAMSARFYLDITTIKFLTHSVTYRYVFQVLCPIISICLLIATRCKGWQMVGQLLLMYISTLTRFHRCYSPPGSKCFQSLCT